MRIFIATVALVVALLSASATAETINAAPDTLAAVLAKVNPGDTVLLADGTYKGGFELTRSGKAGAPIVIKAAGKACVFDGGKDCLNLEGPSFVAVEGIRFQKAERDGLRVVDGTNVEVRRCIFADNTWPGIMTGFAEHFVIEDCESFGSVKSHGIYVGNSADDPVIRRNIVHNNWGNGIHINGDPEMGGDGVISRGLIEGNVIYENGGRGGAAMSVTHVQDSTFRNNLLYNNLAAGFVLYYDTGGDACASKRNQVYHNTVYFRPNEGRSALALKQAATDCRVLNNILIGGKWGALSVEPSCFAGLVCDYNVIANHEGQFSVTNTWDEPVVDVPAAEWTKRGFDVHSSIGVMPEFAGLDVGNLRLLPGSVGIGMGKPLGALVPFDITGTPRPADGPVDCGCYESMREAKK